MTFSKIYLDPSVADFPVTKRILKKLAHLPVIPVHDRREIKIPNDHSRAKKELYLTKLQGQTIRPCQGMGNYVCCGYHTFALVSDCHLDCTYCILQDYLKNNPVITINTNIHEILDEIDKRFSPHPDQLFRIGSGELSDSLALDPLTEFSKDLIDFANTHPNVLMEIKTKTTHIENFINLKHKGNTIIAWSVNPSTSIETEEHDCAPLTARLKSAKLCANKGYPIAFHLDPILHTLDWQKQYTQLIQQMASAVKAQDIAWISLGTLRFTPNLKKIVEERFPESAIMSAELFPSQDGKIRYFRPLREEIYKFVIQAIQTHLGDVPIYLCMETKTVWENVFKKPAPSCSEIMNYLVKKWRKTARIPA